MRKEVRRRFILADNGGVFVLFAVNGCEVLVLGKSLSTATACR
jgi:hypothetical protein